MAKVTVKTAEKRFPTAANLYGLFFEDINRSADSGLYPELLRNRSFEDSIVPDGCTLSEDKRTFRSPTGWECEFVNGEGKQSWIDADNIAPTDIPAWYAEDATMSLDFDDTLNLKRRAALDVCFNAGGRIYNTGFVGVSVDAGKGYDFYMFASKVSGCAKLAVSIESKSGDVYCEKTFKIAEGYAKYSCGFVSAATDRDAVLSIRSCCGCEVKFGFSSLMPADTYNGHGMRPDLMKLLAEMKPRFLRFPGGCIVEGFTDETAMRFSKTVGPVWERQTHWNCWNYRTTNGLGYHEYLQICEDLDLEPLYVFNCGMTCQARACALLSDDVSRDLLEEAKNAIEYAIGGVTTKWGALRAEMGHPAPFKMTYIEIGNENHGPEYNKRYERCYRELKKLYPHIKYISNTHSEHDGLPTEIADEHFYSTPEFFAENMNRYDVYPRSGPEIFVGEFAVTQGYTAQLRSAVAEAMFMVGLEKNQDIVTLASYAPLFENAHYKSWNPNLISFNNYQSYAIPSYYAWKLFGSHRGQTVLATDTEGEKIFRKYSGVPSILGAAGTKFKAARWNGKPLAFGAELMGHIKADGDAFELLPATDDQVPEGRMTADPARRAEFMAQSFVLTSGEPVDAGSFSAEVLVEEGKPVRFGMFTGKSPRADRPDTPEFMKYSCLTWNIEDGKSYVKEGHMRWGDRFGAETPVALRYGEYNTFAYEATPTGGKLFINGEKIGDFELPNYIKNAAVALDDGDQLIVKLVNFSETAEAVGIALDCDVAADYKVYRVSGGAEDANSFAAPTNVCDTVVDATGASRTFTYDAPAYSVNVLVFDKR